ncbi:SNF2 family N-terminal domain-containing protein, partial [Lineolata rhizophorae]
PSLLRGTLREYQHDGLDWLAGLYAGNTNGILADEMGLGKTIQTIALLAHLAVEHEVWGPHLVVVPTSVMLNWEMEFKKWCPGFKILTYYGTIEERKRKREGWMNNDLWNVCITSYQLILQDAAAFKKRRWYYLILDEAHNIKNFQTQRWQTLLTFKTQKRLLLTGTPLQNNLSELWSLLFFLMPGGNDGHGGFAELQKFTTALRNPSSQILDQGRQQLDADAQATVDQLHKVLRPYLLRRLKADVEKQMPGKYEHVVYCRLSKRQRQLYDGFMGRADTRAILASGNYMSIINCLMSLRKVCNHPDLFETRQIVTSFAMPRSAVADFETKDLLVRRRLLRQRDVEMEKVDLDAINLVPTANEDTSMITATRVAALTDTREVDNLVERATRRLGKVDESFYAGTSIDASVQHLGLRARTELVEQLRTCAAQTQRRAQRRPIYGKGLLDTLDLRLDDRVARRNPPPRRRDLSKWNLDSSEALRSAVVSLPERAARMESTIRKFACVTPAVSAADVVEYALTRTGLAFAREHQAAYLRASRGPPEKAPGPDPFHEARVRLSIAFPDKRLLQWDCGKLQRLAALLRQLQAGGHRALIFTQMTRVLDILEAFLNIHGYRYLRLDGATRIEQRQVLTERFNADERITVMILSSRSGGLGINLTGADTVIFYDLDWNPAMDRQCQDRCHRIGQTRDVHVYRLVSEATIEANILRKSDQKRLLDDVIIQKGEFTTDYFNRVTYRDALDDGAATGTGAATPGKPLDADSDPDAKEADAAMDRVLNDVAGLGGANSAILESVEDSEDVRAAKQATKEMVSVDEADFAERAAAAKASS